MKKLTSLLAALMLAFAGLFLSILGASRASATSVVAYFIWNNNGNIAQHQFMDLQGMQVSPSGTEYAYLNMIKAADVTDDSNPAVKINLSTLLAEKDTRYDKCNYAWVPQATIDELANRGYTTWAKWQGLIDELIAENPTADDWDLIHDHFYEPMGAKNGNNTLNTNANRAFRATIYDPTKYEAIKFGVTEDDYHYFPNAWDPVFVESTVDLVGTTKTAPAEYTTYLLEPTLKFSKDTTNNISDIVSVKALDINPGAVTITNSGSDYTIKFNSNYYNAVTFELTDAAGTKYYVKVNRITGRFRDGMQESMGKSTLKMGYILMYDSAKSYNDYEVKALITYKDGSTKIVTATPTASMDWDDEAQGLVSKIEWDGGKNLKSAWFAVDVSKDVVGLDFTVTNKDALKTANVYGGTFTGSGKGLHYDDTILQRIINDFYNAG